MDQIAVCQDWYENNYKKYGVNAQRIYPNDELLRFLGRNFFNLPIKERKKIKVLEVGCGSGSNLWMISKEGFDAYGLDLSSESLKICKLVLKKWNVSAQLSNSSMHKLPYLNNSLNVIVDVLSSYCLDLNDFNTFISESKRVLIKGGKLFLYTPGVNSDAFKKYQPAKKIDYYTLNGIYRKNSPYYGNTFPFRFMSVRKLNEILTLNGFKINYIEHTIKSYKSQKELFEYLSVEAIKI